MFDAKYPEPDPNKKSAKERWETIYKENGGYLYGKEPVSLLKSHASLLKKGKTLDVGTGEGRNAVFLAEKGFNVIGLDASATAIERAKALAQEKGTSAEFKSQNLDFFLMPVMGYDTIVMTYFRPVNRFFSEIRRGLSVGGTFVLEAHTVEHYKKNSNPLIEFEDCFKSNEVLKNLKDLHVLYYNEIPEGDTHLVQLIAQKVNK